MKHLRWLLLFLTALCYGVGFNSHQVSSFTAIGTATPIRQLGTSLFHQILWSKSGTVTTCTISVDSSADGITYTPGGLIGNQTCTSNGSSVVTAGTANFIRVHLTVFSGGGTLSVTYNGYVLNPGGGGTATSFQFSNVPAPAPPTPLFTQLCQNNPQAWMFDPVAGLWADQFSIETYAPSGGWPVGTPGNTLMWCRRQGYNDTGVAFPAIRNAVQTWAHTYGVNEANNNGSDDRILALRTDVPASFTGTSLNRPQLIYGELGLNGAPTGFGSGPDVGQNGIRMVIDDHRNAGALTTPSIAIDASYQDVTTGTAAGSSGIAVRGISNAGTNHNGAGTYIGGLFAIGAGAGANPGQGYGLFLDGVIGSRFTGGNTQLFIQVCTLCTAADFSIQSNSLAQARIRGNLSIPAFTQLTGTIAVSGSFNVNSLATTQLPTTIAPAIQNIGTPGATSYSYKLVAKDANGKTAPVSTAGTTATGNAVLDGTNINRVIPSAAGLIGVSSFDVYRTVGGATQGKIGTITVIDNPNLFIGQFLDDTGLVADGTTASTVNSTGSVSAFTYNTATNCASSGGTCASAAAGRFSIAAAATTATVSTTAVTANSEIFIGEDTTLGTLLSVTCNATVVRTYAVTTKTAGTSFVVTASAAPAANPACLTYHVVN